MQTIHKYLIEGSGTVQMPASAQIIKVDWQKRSLYLWAIVDSHAPLVEKGFHVVPTGGVAAQCSKQNYVGTAVSDDFVFHVFESLES